MSPLPWTSSDEAARMTPGPLPPGPAPAGAAPGVHALDLGPGPEVLVRMPSANAGGPTLLPLADSHRLLLLAPSSRDDTWDVIRHGGWERRPADRPGAPTGPPLTIR
jgi:hypothetical protein